MCQDDERSCLFFRHSSARLCQVVDGLAVFLMLLLPSHQSVNDSLASRTVHVPVAKSGKELSDLRLEYHDQRKHSDVKNHVHDGGYEPHVEGCHKNSGQVERYDSNEDADCGRTFQPSESQKDNQAEKQNVQDVCE